MTEMTLLSSAAGGYKFNFVQVAPIDNDKIQPSIPLPLPNSDADSQLLFRFSGQSETINVEFILFESSTDLSGGTAPAGAFPTGVKTLKEQITFLRDYIYSSSFSTSWVLTLDSMYTSTITVVIDSINFNRPPGSQAYCIGRLQMKRGTLAGVTL